jgi:hypothetical protein
MPSTNKGVVPEKLFGRQDNYYLSRFEVLLPTLVRANETEEMSRRAQRDSNPRPTAPQAAILSKLNYGPSISLTTTMPTATRAVTAAFPSSIYLN